MASICLNMIVKDETAVIRRCLDSVRPYIDAWVILDTGSTDGTQAMIREHLKDLPGDLLEAPWTDFATARNQALAAVAGRCDYVLFMDADDRLVTPPGWQVPPLDADVYTFRIRMAESCDLEFERRTLAATRVPWRWQYPIHEVLTADVPVREARLPGPHVLASHDGRRGQDPDKHAKDIRVLEAALRAEPGHPRHTFYLARICNLAGRLEESLAHHRARVALGGWDEEVFISLLDIARILWRLERPAGEVAQAYLAAHDARPTRAEPLVDLARYFRERKAYPSAYLFAARAVDLSMPEDLLFVERDAYLWRALDEYAVAAFWTGRLEASRDACRRLLDGQALPGAERPRVQANLEFALAGLEPTGPAARR